MDKFLVELPHEANAGACAQAIKIILGVGSHFFSQADWGCKDGEHKAWITLEVENKDEALRIVPFALRPMAKVIKLNSFTMDDVESMLRQHQV